MEKRVVVRFLDGRLLKGLTEDFNPGGDSFTLKVTEGPWHGETMNISIDSLKAVFFVKSLTGNRQYRENKLQEPDTATGQKVTVTFLDGESLRGTATSINLNPKGFYLFPSDPQSNNKRIFVARSAVKQIRVEKD